MRPRTPQDRRAQATNREGGRGEMTEGKIATAEYETVHEGKPRPCVGRLVVSDQGYALKERIALGAGPPGEAFEERTRDVPLDEAKRILQEWTALDIAEVFQIPWE
jgi:hypothetical protein